MPKLSICVSVKNRSRVVVDGEVLSLFPNCVRQLAAIWGMATDDWELVVADFASDDLPLGEWIDEAAGPIPVRVITVNRPYSTGHGQNVAAQCATGDWLLFLSADMLMDRATMDAGLKHLAHGMAYIPYPMLAPGHGETDYTPAPWCVGTVFVTKETFRAVGEYPEFNSSGLMDVVWRERAEVKVPLRLEMARGLIHQWHPTTPEFKNRCHPAGWREDHAAVEKARNGGFFREHGEWPLKERANAATATV